MQRWFHHLTWKEVPSSGATEHSSHLRGTTTLFSQIHVYLFQPKVFTFVQDYALKFHIKELSELLLILYVKTSLATVIKLTSGPLLRVTAWKYRKSLTRLLQRRWNPWNKAWPAILNISSQGLLINFLKFWVSGNKLNEEFIYIKVHVEGCQKYLASTNITIYFMI